LMLIEIQQWMRWRSGDEVEIKIVLEDVSHSTGKD
jgi:hypothetical protein